jgi:hypothetical protein
VGFIYALKSKGLRVVARPALLAGRSNLLAKYGDCFGKERLAMTLPLDFKKAVKADQKTLVILSHWL